MSTQIAMRRCNNCDLNTEHVGPGTSHLLHLVLSVVTVGLWLPVWAMLAVAHRRQSRCRQCGEGVGVTWIDVAVYGSIAILVVLALNQASEAAQLTLRAF